jgi:creatinine amidohydrolase/Fe(II)-dependent formamide hydrolase-like protein
MIRLAQLTAPEAATLARDPRAIVLQPLGAIEQHGPHLPTAGRLARRRGAGA